MPYVKSCLSGVLLDSPSACTIVLPQPPSGQAIDPTQIRVVYEVNGQTTDEVLIGLSDVACSHGDGWYLDIGSNITFCAKTCTTLHLDSNLTISVSAPCHHLGPIQIVGQAAAAARVHVPSQQNKNYDESG
jgi:hypothetical protein